MKRRSASIFLAYERWPPAMCVTSIFSTSRQSTGAIHAAWVTSSAARVAGSATGYSGQAAFT